MSKAFQDPNFAVTPYDARGIHFVDALDHEHVVLEGFPYFRQNHSLCRLPEPIVPAMPELLQWVCRHPAGGVLRFKTDSRRICLRVRFRTGETCVRTPWHALFGFDAYEGSGAKRRFVKTLYNVSDKMVLLDGLTTDDDKSAREWTIYFPVRNHPDKIELGIEKGAKLGAPSPRRLKKPILFYGSSIVEGGCASRGGLSYPAIIGRELDAQVINYGFGGSANGEIPVADAIGKLDLAAIVIDYDHNAPTPELLQKTHAPFFARIRTRHPRTPVLLVSSVNYHNDPGFFGRRAAVIEQTCKSARASGDKNVWFLHGKTIFPAGRWWDCSGDRLHPNDYGFRCMADAIGKRLKTMPKLNLKTA